MAERKCSEEELDEMLADATVDAYGDYEEFMSIVCHLDSNMVFPFKAQVLGDTVEVLGIEANVSSPGRGVVANVRKKGKAYTIGLAELTVDPDSENAEWIEMLDYWLEEY